MEELLTSLQWTPVLLSTILAFGLGWLWYSDKLFGAKWRAGIGAPLWTAPMWMPMSAQLVGTFLLAVITNLAAADGHVGHAVLVAFTISVFLKANGLYSGKSKYAIGVEVGYVLAMVAIMVAVNMML